MFYLSGKKKKDGGIESPGIGAMRSAIGDVGAVVTGLTLGGNGSTSDRRGRAPPIGSVKTKSSSSLSLGGVAGAGGSSTSSSSASLLLQQQQTSQVPPVSSSTIVSGEAYPLVMDTKLKIIEILQVSTIIINHQIVYCFNFLFSLY